METNKIKNKTSQIINKNMNFLVSIPLVLHGTSGISDDIVKEVFEK